MKSRSIFKINARNLGLISNHQHLPQDQIASEDDAVRLVRSGGYHYELLNLMKLLMLTATTNN